ncbi:MAG TPA: hypothetical protein VMD75_00775 [Candidatus Binataceae bacterium]|nr:hypothetical protein [Candidatus Binataceae bacterium]
MIILGALLFATLLMMAGCFGPGWGGGPGWYGGAPAPVYYPNVYYTNRYYRGYGDYPPHGLFGGYPPAHEAWNASVRGRSSYDHSAEHYGGGFGAQGGGEHGGGGGHVDGGGGWHGR